MLCTCNASGSVAETFLPICEWIVGVGCVLHGNAMLALNLFHVVKLPPTFSVFVVLVLSLLHEDKTAKVNVATNVEY
jgi:hypothetical protein